MELTIRAGTAHRKWCQEISVEALARAIPAATVRHVAQTARRPHSRDRKLNPEVMLWLLIGRTPKVGKANLLAAVRSTTIETALGLGCWGLATTLLMRSATHAFTTYTAYIQVAHAGQSGLEADLGAAAAVAGQIGPWWAVSGSAGALMLLAAMQGMVYLSAPALCLMSLRSAPTAEEARRRALDDRPGEGARERRLLVGALVGAAGLATLLFVASLAPSQTVSQQHQQTLTNLLGPSNLTSPTTPTSSATTTPSGASGVGGAPSATTTAPSSTTGTPTAIATSSTTGMPTATATSSTTGTPTPISQPTPRATTPPTPTPHIHP